MASSALGNPGPCGAGAVIHYPDLHGGRHTDEFSAALGDGTNNIGELWAIGMVGDAVYQEQTRGFVAPQQGYIISDSTYARGCLKMGWSSVINQDLVQAVDHSLGRTGITWSILWIPGHANVTDNDRADEAANRGSQASRDGNFLADLPSLIEHHNFIP